MLRVLTTGDGYCGVPDHQAERDPPTTRWLRFGLGVEKTADVEIHWPSGLKQQLKSIAANQLATVKESSGLG
jgi:hypothetical protein